MRKLIAILALLLMPMGSRAQDVPLFLQGPVVAFGTAALDRIVLYDVGAADGVRRELNFGEGWHYVWGFSPDGCRVLYTLSDGINTARLYSAQLDGSDAREMVMYSGGEWWGVWEPTWSSAGRIAFTMQRYTLDDNGDLERQYHTAWVDANAVLASGAPAEAQFYSVTGDEHSPQWSPDGAWLAYISHERRFPGADIYSTAEPTREPPPDTPPIDEDLLLREGDLWVVSADGETKYRLTYFDVGSVRAPRWSPDGELIAFTYAPSPNNDQFWMIANQPAAIATQLSQLWSQILDTTWLPDSSAMLGAVRDFRDVDTNRLWVIPLLGAADESAILYLSENASAPAMDYADYPRFSADGRWLALRSAYQLMVVDTETLAWGYADGGQLGNTPPVWTPAGFTGELDC
jgi:Tol biopolymer transport system component